LYAMPWPWLSMLWPWPWPGLAGKVVAFALYPMALLTSLVSVV